jgi:hypothetical protein
MDRNRILRQALADTAWLAQHWPHLVEVRIPGTARPWRQTEVDITRRAERDREARAERLERVDVAPGESPAPVHVDILDVLAAITVWADGLAERCWREAGGHGPWQYARSAYHDPRTHLAYLTDALPDVGEETLAWAARWLGIVKRDAALGLRLVYDGQRIGTCPWCRQERALVVRVDEDPDEPVLVVCEGYGRICEPPERDCGRWVRGRPAWLLWAEGEWLAARIRHEETAQPAYLVPSRPMKVYCAPNGCRLWQGAVADTPAPDLPRTCGRADCVAPKHIIRVKEAAGV